MGTKRKRYSAEFKAKVALEAVKGLKTRNQIASEFGVHPVQISQWKKELLDGVGSVFNGKNIKEHKKSEEEKSRLYEKIGRLEMELDWLKKKMESID